MKTALMTMLKREFQLRLIDLSSVLYGLAFFVLVLLLFPLAMGADSLLLKQVGVAAIWIAAVLAVLLGMDGLFCSEMDDGTLEQLMVARQSVGLWALVKVGVHWLMTGLVMALLSMLSIPLFGLTTDEAVSLVLLLLLGTPILTLIAAIASALTVSLRRGGVLMPLIALPLQLPILIFATGAIEVLRTGGDVLPILALLTAGLILSIIFAPIALSAALRLAISS